MPLINDERLFKVLRGRRGQKFSSSPARCEVSLDTPLSMQALFNPLQSVTYAQIELSDCTRSASIAGHSRLPSCTI